MNAAAIAIVCIGGALGAVSRFWITRIGALMAPERRFPLPTLFVNLSGSALLGAVVALSGSDLTYFGDTASFLFFGVGFCGAYTTFSSFCTETMALASRSWSPAALYVISTVVGSIAAFVVVFELVA